MIVTNPAWFEVVDKRQGHLWLEVERGKDQGRRISIPLDRDNTPDEIEALFEGDRCKVVLRSDSESSPDWEIKAVKEIEMANECQ